MRIKINKIMLFSIAPIILLALGCTSSQSKQPYSLTGSADAGSQARRVDDRGHVKPLIIDDQAQQSSANP